MLRCHYHQSLFARPDANSLPCREPSADVSSSSLQYVYAFLVKFTDMRATSSTSLLVNVTSLEDALTSSSPASPSSSRRAGPSSPASSLSSVGSDPNLNRPLAPVDSTVAPSAPEPPVPEASELLINILKVFKDNLPEAPDSHQRKDWFGWLFRFVKNRLADGSWKGVGLRWMENKMKRVGVRALAEHEREFWLLDWEDKVRGCLLRGLFCGEMLVPCAPGPPSTRAG